MSAELKAKNRGLMAELHEVEQTLGAALGYPWFKDDQKNFPGATAADGVCIGEHVAGTLAQEAADALASKEGEILSLKEQLASRSQPSGAAPSEQAGPDAPFSDGGET